MSRMYVEQNPNSREIYRGTVHAGGYLAPMNADYRADYRVLGYVTVRLPRRASLVPAARFSAWLKVV